MIRICPIVTIPIIKLQFYVQREQKNHIPKHVKI